MSLLPRLSRRRFLQSTALAGTAVAAGTTRVQAATVPLPFLHGVASGDPLPTSVVLWTRITPDADALPGSGLGAATRVRWEVGIDAAFHHVVSSGEVRTDAASDHTIHVDPFDLEPDMVYFYRFTVLDGPHAGSQSPTGRTRTAPAFDSSPEQLTAAVASCANWESGYFSAYADMATRGRAGELDLVVFLGDYIYEYGRGEYVGKNGAVRPHEPAHEIITLQDYRIRHGHYRTDPDLQAAHAALPWVLIWDDHETADNSWREGAENHDPATEGAWLSRRDAALQAYLEWLPVRTASPSAGGHLYRSFRFGDLAELMMLDLRSYRDQPAAWSPTALADFNDPARTMMGSEQFEWLRRTIDTSPAHWTVIGSSVMFSPTNLLPLQQNPQTSSVAEFLGARTAAGIPMNPDQWDGFAADRGRLLELLRVSGRPALFLTGDIHSEWAHDVWAGDQLIGVELVCTSISAPNVDEILKLPADNAISHLAEALVREVNPHIRHVDLDAHGYSIARLRRDGVEMRWLRTVDVVVPGTGVETAIGLAWQPGRGFGI
ncbi:alkaline phosphatase D family protein [Corynebacterium suedekumii]|uniref:Alkaline phosphatase D family protein n=1 Tax=Corynebacterium suedekumii TaxID=3049801 RepID=A0ABY8VKV4_9CORY|nr:alkaline phosphatase D family protein [Corynebacterium suedekumii]WIM70199.1 alkaline phosphatase D family protein [Corynebacterium suedekumii]